jgi:hypothetical protein
LGFCAETGLAQPLVDISGLPAANFIENAGQWNDAVRYRVSLNNATVWFADEGPCFQFHKDTRELSDSVFSSRLIKVRWAGSNRKITIQAEGRTAHISNFFVGNDLGKWRTGVPSFETVVYKNVYTGIDVRYYLNGDNVEYDFVLSPGADPSQIRIHYDGAESVCVTEAGDLLVETAVGILTERCPIFYQQSNATGILSSLSGTFRVISRDSFGFQLDGAHDTGETLIIDPVLSFSTYLGGSGSEYGWGIDVDDEENIYVTGNTFSTDYPLADPLQPVYGGTKDIYITKLNSTDGLIFSTYLGGSDSDENPSLAVDSDHNVLVIGRTFSNDFP